MNKHLDYILRGLHHLYINNVGTYLKPLDKEMNPDIASDIIYETLNSENPCMISRFGSVEILCAYNYLGIYKYKHNWWKYITDKSPQFWWNKVGLQSMQNNAGFFPLEEEYIIQFCEKLIKDAKEIDILGSWRREERLFIDPQKTKLVQLLLLEPYHSSNPWSRILAGKKVLVVHPFANTINHQYNHYRALLFKNQKVLPEFELHTVKAEQTIGGNSSFHSWFDALKFMENEMDSIDYDICLIGCGAYGLSLAAHVKRQGKKAVHLGGALQLLFGIKGKRWLNPHYGTKSLPFIHENYYRNLMNEYWTVPSKDETPITAEMVENACYW